VLVSPRQGGKYTDLDEARLSATRLILRYASTFVRLVDCPTRRVATQASVKYVTPVGKSRAGSLIMNRDVDLKSCNLLGRTCQIRHRHRIRTAPAGRWAGPRHTMTSIRGDPCFLPAGACRRRIGIDSVVSARRFGWRRFLFFPLFLLILWFLAPYFAERVQHAVTRGREKAERETASERKDGLSLANLSRAYQDVPKRVGRAL